MAFVLCPVPHHGRGPILACWGLWELLGCHSEACSRNTVEHPSCFSAFSLHRLLITGTSPEPRKPHFSPSRSRSGDLTEPA